MVGSREGIGVYVGFGVYWSSDDGLCWISEGEEMGGGEEVGMVAHGEERPTTCVHG